MPICTGDMWEIMGMMWLVNNHKPNPIFDGLYHPWKWLKMVILGMDYDYFNHLIDITM